MTVPSVKYILFLLTVCVVSCVLNPRYRVILLLCMSWAFYALCQPEYTLLLVTATAMCYFCAIAYEDAWLNRKRIWLLIGFTWLLGELVFYKYLGFFLNTWVGITGKEFSSQIQRLLPIGISFYTFSALSYLFDISRGKTKAERNYLNCALFISFFPALLSGPINRAGDLLPQIREPSGFSLAAFKMGLFRIVIGTIKKLVVANTLGRFVDAVYKAPETATGSVVALAVAAYSLQIYYDFSGYTDIALGSAKVLGFILPENFNAPYFSESVRDFWRRWHISLTSWFRDYLYIPLGGSHVSKGRLYLNILIVFAVSGLWHGADWSFVLWGLLNGVFQVIEMLLTSVGHTLRERIRLRSNSMIQKAFRIAVTFMLISVAWVFFRADNVNQAFDILGRIVTGGTEAAGSYSLHDFAEYRPLALAFICVFLFSWLDYRTLIKKQTNLWQDLAEKSLQYWMVLAVLTAFVAVFGVYGSGFDAAAFIYFQF